MTAIRLLFLPLALLLVFAGCSSSPKQPEWLEHLPEEYPASRFISATGTADSREAADSRALANLAKVFEVAVTDRSMDFSEANIGPNGQSSHEQQASRFVGTEAREVLEGATIVEHWQSETAEYHSLAVLQKAPAARRFSTSIKAADAQTDNLIAYANHEAPNPVAALGALDRARKLQLEREDINSNLAVVSGSGIPSRSSSGDIETMIRKGLAQLQFGAQSSKPEVMGALQAAIASLGIQYRPDSSWQLWGNLDQVPVYQKQGWYWLRGSMQLSLRHQDDVVANKRWPFKVSATDPGMAEQRARDALSNELAGQLYEMLVTSSAGRK